MYQKVKSLAVGVLLLAALTLAACQPTAPISVEPAAEATKQPTKQIVVPDLTATAPPKEEPDQNEEEEMSVESDPKGTPIPEGLAPLVKVAVADLASRLNVDPQKIEVVTAEPVTWPDGSLGCPQPGMMYTQVLVDGLKIVLRADQILYNYHSGGSRSPFLCENFSPSEKATPIDLVPPPSDDLDK